MSETKAAFFFFFFGGALGECFPGASVYFLGIIFWGKSGGALGESFPGASVHFTGKKLLGQISRKNGPKKKNMNVVSKNCRYGPLKKKLILNLKLRLSFFLYGEIFFSA